jgi:LysM repeat protein
MKFSSDSIKLKSKPHNEDFSLDVETPRGHFFALLDFGHHDYANLNATLKGKLETIVGSFVTLSRFSAELFLGFLAKEINNFLHNLGEQSGGPELLASGALCLVNGNRLTYFLCGDVQLNVVNNGRLLPLFGPAAGETASAAGADPAIEQLGARNREAPLTDVVQSFTLQDADLVLLMTRGLQEAFAGKKLADEIASIGSTDPQVICESLMRSGASAREDRSLIVMGGPYEKYLDPVLADLSKAVAALESRMEALNEDQSRTSNQLEADSRIAQQLEVLKDDLRGKAARIDLLELDEKVKNLSATLAKKANSAGSKSEFAGSDAQSVTAHADDATRRSAIPITMVALLVLATALIGSVIGGWIQSRAAKQAPEVWSVKTAGNQITISRLDADQATVTLNVSQPLNATGEQRFSSFADAKRYIDTIAQTAATAPSASSVPSPAESASPNSVTEVTVKRGDSLRTLAEQYNVPQGRLMALNPTIRRWPAIRIGQKIVVPAAGNAPETTPTTAASPVSSPPAQEQTVNSPNTTEITVVPGDSLNRLSAKYKATPDRLRELNPQVSNWATILPGQKILVPAPPAG